MLKVNSNEILNRTVFVSNQNRIYFATIELLKNEWILQFHCTMCGKQQKNLKVFIKHSLEHILKIKEDALSELIIKALEHQEETLPDNVPNQEENDGEEMFNIKVKEEVDDFLDIMDSIKVEKDEEQAFNTTDNICGLKSEKIILEEANLKSNAEVIPQEISRNKLKEKNMNASEGLASTASVKSFRRDFFCDQCKIYFRFESLLKLHHKRHHTNFKDTQFYKCDECQKTLQSKRGLFVHKKNIHSAQKKKPVVCDICHATYSNQEKLKEHRSQCALETKPYACKVCKRTFKRSSELKEHSFIHSEKRPHVCKICDKAFKSKRTLRGHLKCHSNERRFVCNLCEKRFKRNCDLINHNKLHLNGKMYECNICHLKFDLRSLMRVHRRSHADDFKHECSHCSEAFKDKTDLCMHLEKHKLHDKKSKN